MTRSICSVAVAALAVAGFAHAEDQKPLSNGIASDYTCQHPPYQIQMLSKSPLVIYIEDFITPDERAHLQSLAQGHFRHSAVLGTSGSSAINSVRTSQSTTVQRDPVVRCVEERALLFQGHEYPESHLEPIQLVKYAVTEHYHFHTDWFTDATHTTAANGGNRVSSFFAYVKADNVTGGGTNFPLLTAPRNEKWCKFVDCDVEYDAGVTFKPLEGNAVFWVNMDTGKGDGRTLHAGLPVVSGEKIGMNIWTREGPLGNDIRGI